MVKVCRVLRQVVSDFTRMRLFIQMRLRLKEAITKVEALEVKVELAAISGIVEDPSGNRIILRVG